jgi:hypothetical protein
MHRREGEPELSREDIEAEEPGQTERIFAIGEHMKVRALVPAGSVGTGPNLSLEVATLAPLCGERNLKVRRELRSIGTIAKTTENRRDAA